MHFKTTFFLLLALAVVAGVIWMVEWDPEVSHQPPAEKKLLSIEPEKITYVSFYREGEFIECVNDHGRWMINKPVAARAASSCMHRILAGIEMLPRGETITAAQRQARGLTLNEYGLAKPQARLVLGSATTRTLLLIGSESPMKNSVYVQVDGGEDIIATSTHLLAVMPRQVADIRDPLLLPGTAAYVRRLEIKRPNGPFVQLIKEGAEWVIHKPVLARADWVKVSHLLDRLFSMSVQQFVSDNMGDPVAYGLSDDEAVLQVSVWQADEKTPNRLIFGKNADEQGNAVYAAQRNSRSLVTVGWDRLSALLAATDDLRDPRLYFMAPGKMAMIRIEEGERVLEFRKHGEQAWQIVEPRQWKADNRMVADLISRLNTFRFDHVLDGAQRADLDWDHPAHVIRVADEHPSVGSTNEGANLALTVEKQMRVLLLSSPQPGQAYVFARFEGEPLIYRISASSSSTISLDPLSYRDSTVLALAPSTIRKITLKKHGIEHTVEQTGPGVWQPAPPATGDVNRGVITRLLAQVADLKVMRFERSDIRDLAVYGLKDARVSLTLSLSGEEGIQKTLLLGDPSEDLGVYAMFQGQDLVFVLEKALVDSLAEDWLR